MRARPPPAPSTVVAADDRPRADEAYRLASGDTAMLYAGDLRNARQLLSALARRGSRLSRSARTFAIGTGTRVLTVILATRGVRAVIGIDTSGVRSATPNS